MRSATGSSHPSWSVARRIVEFLGFFAPVLLGNLVGGGVLVAVLNQMQVAREQRRAHAARAVASPR